jgi:cell division protein FtsB
MNSKKITKIINFLFLLIAFSIAVSLIRNIYQAKSANQKLVEAQNRLDELKQQQEELKQQLTQVLSKDFQEKQARDQLGLAKQGEIVLVLPDEEVLRALSPRQKKQEKPVLPDPNWKQWLNLFI